MRTSSRLIKFFSLAAVGFFFSAYAGAQTTTGCLAHHPKYIEDTLEVTYDNGCTGHDEPEIDPISSLPGSARDLTWTVVLPGDGNGAPVSALGPTFWFGGTVTDKKSLFGQAFVELQFYPDSIVTHCTNTGAFVVNHAPNKYSACSPVWKLTQTGSKGKFHETNAFNAMLEDSSNPGNPLVMSGGDTVTVHWFTTAAQDGFHVTVTDVTTGGSGTIVLNSPTEGPLMPAYDSQTLGSALQWGGVFDTPNSFVWEIGHADVFGSTPAAFCVGGQTNCNSYDASSWAGTTPIQIKSVTFADGSAAKQFATVSDLGGKASLAPPNGQCSVYGGPFCIYPWYTQGATGFHYGVDFADTIRDFGQADQFAQTPKCGGPFGPNSTYCATILKTK
jgi:hypothetical protein